MSKNKKAHQPVKSPTPPNQPHKPDNKSFAVQATKTTFSGPLPHPEVLEYYNKIIPNGADRITAMAERQAMHRQELEKKAIQSEITDSRIGLWLGFIVALAGIGAGTACILNGYQIAGSILGGAPVTGLVGVFVYGSRQRRKERETKHREVSDNERNQS